MKFVSVMTHDGVTNHNCDVYGTYNMEAEAHKLLCTRAWSKAITAFEDGAYKMIARIQHEYDPDQKLFNVTVLDQKIADPPKLIEINLPAKPKEGKKKSVKKSPVQINLEEVDW